MSAKDDAKALLDGLEGVTPGPWELLSGKSGWTAHATFTVNGSKRLGICSHNGEKPNMRETMEHIARCDPETMRAICTRLLELEAENYLLRNDAAYLLATIDWLEEVAGEGPKGKDAALIYQIRQDLEGGKHE